MNTIVSFIIVLGVLIFVHELGHFLFAKFFGVRVLKFSLGFGPKLIGRVIGETEYVISAFPLGGYVKMFGENPDEQQVDAADQHGSFAHKSVAESFCIVLAGPVFNLLFAVILFFGLFSVIGVPQSVDTTRIGKVNEDSPAFSAGIKADDVIVQINGKTRPVLGRCPEGSKGEWRQADRHGDPARSGGNQPDGDARQDSVKNVFGEEVEQRYMIGIVKDDEVSYNRVGLLQAFSTPAGRPGCTSR